MNDEQLTIELTLSSSNEQLVPALLTYLQHKYQYGTQAEALAILSDLFNGFITQDGLIAILTDKHLPLFRLDDFRDKKLTFVFAPCELIDGALEKIEDQ